MPMTKSILMCDTQKKYREKYAAVLQNQIEMSTLYFSSFVHLFDIDYCDAVDSSCLTPSRVSILNDIDSVLFSLVLFFIFHSLALIYFQVLILLPLLLLLVVCVYDYNECIELFHHLIGFRVCIGYVNITYTPSAFNVY